MELDKGAELVRAILISDYRIDSVTPVNDRVMEFQVAGGGQFIMSVHPLAEGGPHGASNPV